MEQLIEKKNGIIVIIVCSETVPSLNKQMNIPCAK